jgi:hypothetical protein
VECLVRCAQGTSHELSDTFRHASPTRDPRQIIINQVNLDTSVNRLVEVMDTVFAFVHEATALDLSAGSSQKDILASMAKQTTECAYFIRDYAKNKDFCTHSFVSFSHGSLTTFQGSELRRI